MRRRTLAWAAALGTVAAWAASASAQCPDERSGYTGQPSSCAQPSDTGHYIGYTVGGGSPFHGEAPGPGEGVWGWDYAGVHFWPRIALLWNHGRRCQGGTGAYRTDGPQVIQDIKEKKGE